MRKIRKAIELRPIVITTDYMTNPLASCLIEHGNTKVICCVSLEESVPR